MSSGTSTEESQTASVAGCDIDAPSIEWIALNLPWLDAFVVDEAPPIPRPDGSYDLIWGDLRLHAPDR